jgi:adenylate cyclase
MAVEIERKFLVADHGWKIARSVRIRDGLIANNNGQKVRVRIANGVATIAIKSRRRGPARTEFEYAIPYLTPRKCYAQCVAAMSSIRFDTSCHMPATLGRSTSMRDFWKVLFLAEIELTDADQKLTLPVWIGEEVTADPRYRKVNMVAARFSKPKFSDQTMF